MDSELSNKEIKNYPLKLSFSAFRETGTEAGDWLYPTAPKTAGER